MRTLTWHHESRTTKILTEILTATDLEAAFWRCHYLLCRHAHGLPARRRDVMRQVTKVVTARSPGRLQDLLRINCRKVASTAAQITPYKWSHRANRTMSARDERQARSRHSTALTSAHLTA